MANSTLVVLAAGMGSRYGGLKQMDPMGPNGETILDYSVFDAIRAGFGKVVFVIREDFAEAFREGVGSRFADRIEVAYAFQRLDDLPDGFSVPEGRAKPWGTAHAVRAARDAVDGPFAVVNADDFYGRDAYARGAEFLASLAPGSSPAECALVGYYLDNTLSEHGGVNRGITTIDSGFLRDVEEIIDISRKEDGRITGEDVGGAEREMEAKDLVSMNFWCFGPEHFDQLEGEFRSFMEARGAEPKSECYIPTVVDSLISAGKAECRVLATTSSWFGVTYPDDKPHVTESIRGWIAAGEYPEALR